MLITPSAVPYDEIQPDDLIHLDLDGTVQARPGNARPWTGPSTEWRLHAAILAARPEVSAILHAHLPIPPPSPASGKRSRPSTTWWPSQAATPSAARPTPPSARPSWPTTHWPHSTARQACLLANHGMVALGASPARALALAQEVETLAEQYCLALQLGEPAILDDRQMADVLDRFAAYGR
jgi:L-fuculose-phosphate aldolase